MNKLRNKVITFSILLVSVAVFTASMGLLMVDKKSNEASSPRYEAGNTDETVDMSVSASVNGQELTSNGVVKPGSTVDIKVHLKNNRTSSATGIFVNVVIPEGYQYEDKTTTQKTLNVNSMASGSEEDLTFQVIVPSAPSADLKIELSMGYQENPKNVVEQRCNGTSYNGTECRDVITSYDTVKATLNLKALPLGSLTVTNYVEGDNREFTFTVALSDKSINATYGDMVFKDGVAVFKLKHGESMTATNLPNVGYTVTESDNEGYTVQFTDATGDVDATTASHAIFLNIPPKGGEKVPNTLDGSSVSMWILSLGAMLVAVSTSIYFVRKKA